ncbi:MAG: chemotaxis protein CheA [Terracidiphilus sp.]
MLQEYLVEARELLDKAQADTLKLATAARKDEVLASIFRAFHTIKGSANHVGAGNLVSWTHDLEDLLDKLRSGSLPLTADRIEVILHGLDVIRRMVEEIAQQQISRPGPADLGKLIQQLARDEESSPPGFYDELVESQTNANAKDSADTIGIEHLSNRENTPLHDLLPSKASEIGSMVRDGSQPSSLATSPLISSSQVASTSSRPSTHDRESSSAAGKTMRGDGVEKTIRIDALRLDAVMNQVGELVLLRNRLASAAAAPSDENESMTRIAREMDLVVNDLQNTMMRLRMQPCKRLFQQLPRVVHDVSKQLGKEVTLEIAGEDVEIDKSIVEALSGPMTHLVRNSLDHGIELPEIRVAANKPRAALLRVAAIHLGDRVRIEVGDDGKGIDCRLILQKAIEKAVVTAEQAARLSEQDAVELIFMPGFSTKEKASDLSGRGVGMDVVKETASRLRGRLTIDTVPGRGTRVAMEFPLTLAVLPVVYLRLREEIYALPISSIDSLTDLEESRVHRLAGRMTYRVDGTHTVPLVDLGAILQRRPLRPGKESVEGVLTERGIFVVSEVLGNEDAVVKPIDFVSGQNWYQGATISGLGNVVLILDAGALSSSVATAAEGEN